jgi:hypothetical protein
MSLATIGAAITYKLFKVKTKGSKINIRLSDKGLIVIVLIVMFGIFLLNFSSISFFVNHERRSESCKKILGLSYHYDDFLSCFYGESESLDNFIKFHYMDVNYLNFDDYSKIIIPTGATMFYKGDVPDNVVFMPILNYNKLNQLASQYDGLSKILFMCPNGETSGMLSYDFFENKNITNVYYSRLNQLDENALNFDFLINFK